MRHLRFILPLLLLFTACGTQEPEQEDLVQSPEEVNPHITKNLEKIISSHKGDKFLFVGKDSLLTTENVFDFYKDKKFEPVWSSSGVFNSDFLIMQRLIKNARYYYGLNPDDYHFHLIEKT